MEQTSTKKIGCLLMAAGNATRFQSNKLLEDFQGKPLVQHALEAIPKDRFAQVVVVTQYAAIGNMAKEFGFTVIQNDHPEWGAAYTIRLGTKAMEQCNAILYMVADQPLLDAASVERILETWQQHPCNIISAAHNGRTGNPCLFPLEFFEELSSLEGDVGGKRVIHRYPEQLLTVELSQQELVDCDTPQALQELRANT